MRKNDSFLIDKFTCSKVFSNDLTSKLDKFDSIPDPSFHASNCLFLAVMAATKLFWIDQGTSMLLRALQSESLCNSKADSYKNWYTDEILLQC